MTSPVLNPEQMQGLFRYAVVLCQHEQDACDLLQASLEVYLLEMRAGKGVLNPEAYLRTLIRHRFIDAYRKQQRWQEDSFEEQQSYDISPLNLEELHINQQQLDSIWKTLCPQDRDILYHWAVLGYSTDEACELLGIPRGTFLSRIHRLRKQCRKADQDSPGSVSSRGISP